MSIKVDVKFVALDCPAAVKYRSLAVSRNVHDRAKAHSGICCTEHIARLNPMAVGRDTVGVLATAAFLFAVRSYPHPATLLARASAWRAGGHMDYAVNHRPGL